MNDYTLPPKDCKLQESCPQLFILREAKMKKPILGMEQINPTCALCAFFYGEITNDEIIELRRHLKDHAIRFIQGLLGLLLILMGYSL